MSIQWAVTRMVNCIFLRNSDGNLYVPYLNWNGDAWVVNFNRLDNDWNDNDRLVSCQSLRSLLVWESFLLTVFHPSANHSSNFCKLCANLRKDVCIYSFHFPQKLEKELERIKCVIE